jgi:hypothetical protein
MKINRKECGLEGIRYREEMLAEGTENDNVNRGG